MMNQPLPGEDELLNYACDELDESAQAAIDAMLADAPEGASEAKRLADAYRRVTEAVQPRIEQSDRISSSLAFRQRLADRLRQEATADLNATGESDGAEGSDDHLLLYACDELAPNHARDVETRLRSDPAQSAEVSRLRHALDALGAEAASGARADHGPESDAFKKKLFTRIATEFPAAPDRRRPSAAFYRWMRHLTVGLAACLGLAAVMWVIVGSTSPAAAYTLSDLPQRLRALRSLHVRGWVYDREGTGRQPLEWYIERPHRYWFQLPVYGRSGYTVSDGHTWMKVDHDRREFVTHEDTPFRASIQTEQSFQNELINWLTGPGVSDYALVRNERIDGRDVEVYERTMASQDDTRLRAVIWFEPDSGLVVRSKQFQQVGEEPERLYSECEVIEPNVTPRPDMFAFDAPNGYAERAADADWEQAILRRVKVDTSEAVVRWAFNISDNGLLICWSHHETDRLTNMNGLLRSLEEVTLTIGPTWDLEDWAYRHQVVRTDQGRRQWHWSVIVPQERGTIETGMYRFRFSRGDDAMTLITGVLSFDRAELDDVIQQAQQITLADAGSGQVLDLAEIESRIEALRVGAEATPLTGPPPAPEQDLIERVTDPMPQPSFDHFR
ncbi:MAG: hypothetical protein CMJ18_27110 [Phycisphaeraceae bacterium]|nr:hypothetical protein [Phycisphaeraceae bacterium]